MKRPAPKAQAPREFTMREFRAAPAKILRRAARAKVRVRVGEFVLEVNEVALPERRPALHGCMRGTGRIVGSPDALLSANDDWSTDG